MSAALPTRSPTGLGERWENREDLTLLYDARRIILAGGQQISGMLNQTASDIDVEAAERAALQVRKPDIEDTRGAW